MNQQHNYSDQAMLELVEKYADEPIRVRGRYPESAEAKLPEAVRMRLHSMLSKSLENADFTLASKIVRCIGINGSGLDIPLLHRHLYAADLDTSVAATIVFAMRGIGGREALSCLHNIENLYGQEQEIGRIAGNASAITKVNGIYDGMLGPGAEVCIDEDPFFSMELTLYQSSVLPISDFRRSLKLASTAESKSLLKMLDEIDRRYGCYNFN